MTRGARAIVVVPDIRSAHLVDPDARLEEGRGLAKAISIVVADSFIIPVRQVRPGTLFGAGQIERIAAACEMAEAELVIVDGTLSAVQQRNLEEQLGRKIIDRTGLILEIFGERAATAEGRMQVELAHLDYQAGRLVRSWTHLERQRGGYGFLGGPGETQIEADRRMIRDRMARLRNDLDQVRRTRALHRSRRERAPWPLVALVGYTNAGKSTLFNSLTGATVMAEDLLFATLDPTMRAVSLPGLDKIILSDTVGFISDLPTQLVAAFRATLEEVTAADLIIHVRDISSPAADEQKIQVEKVLRDLDINTGSDTASQIPVIEAWNKWDLLSAQRADELGTLATSADVDTVAISATGGFGLAELEQLITRHLTPDAEQHDFVIPASDGKRIAWLHAHGDVLMERDGGTDQQGPLVNISVKLTPLQYGRFESL
ncbi:GTPase HflX [Croceicoccus sp. F390]|uniref:GTPase HflX n=1 Tax=Croceicoccus esteveae TaxID=3075597 RepID=A0ABU2ZK90_9SPHN|nr:GTPase HflX [Croceicoccus sp. F390]MDT0576636.1 GTPase HflX [Croceicoccus sp. F390]